MQTRDGRDAWDEAFEARYTLEKARDAAEIAEMERNNVINRLVYQGVPVAELAQFYGISRQMIYRIAKGTIATTRRGARR